MRMQAFRVWAYGRILYFVALYSRSIFESLNSSWARSFENECKSEKQGPHCSRYIPEDGMAV